MDNHKLIKLALEARQKAYAPYSKHRVGAVLVCQDGKVFTGANVENCSFSLLDCAERVAIVKAVSEGYRTFKKLVVVTGNPDLTPPCGACRQILKEFSDDLEIILSNPKKKIKIFQLKDLLPHAFGPNQYHKGRR